jgi:hypothetical protein
MVHGPNQKRGWTEALKAACTGRCGDMGEPSCHSLVEDCEPCADCLEELYGPAEKLPPRCPDTGDLFKP